MNTSDQLVSQLLAWAPVLGGLVTALVAVLLWVGRMAWTVARRLSALEAQHEAAALAQGLLQDQLRAVHDRAEGNRQLSERLASDVLRQAAEHAHRVEVIALRLEAAEERTREALARQSLRAAKHSGQLHEAIRFTRRTPVPPKGRGE